MQLKLIEFDMRLATPPPAEPLRDEKEAEERDCSTFAGMCSGVHLDLSAIPQKEAHVG